MKCSQCLYVYYDVIVIGGGGFFVEEEAWRGGVTSELPLSHNNNDDDCINIYCNISYFSLLNLFVKRVHVLSYNWRIQRVIERERPGNRIRGALYRLSCPCLPASSYLRSRPSVDVVA